MFTNQNKYRKHSYYMNLALDQAHKVLGNTKTNPSVGCVLVKNGNVISAASTSFKGRPHAESNAINFSKTNIKDSHLYTTLEPCSHYGVTPPCVNAIIKKKIKKVYYSINDPDIKTFNKAKIKFKKKNIQVNVGLLKTKIKHFYQSYFKSRTNKLPFVTCKIAISKDFFMINKKSKWITNEYSRGRVHIIRSLHDCIITSSETVNKDNPRLNCRIEGLEKRSPARFILDRKLKIRMNSYILKDASKYRTFIFYSNKKYKKIKSLRKLGVKLFRIDCINGNELNLKSVLYVIKKLGYSRVLLEAGYILSTSFLKNYLVDEFKLFISSNKIGKNGRASINKIKNYYIKAKKPFKERVNLFGDKLITYYIK
tara:strand:- start:6589 stop:7692 length:1104 start_codon:yes stop_codon:yes gene_type:complete